MSSPRDGDDCIVGESVDRACASRLLPRFDAGNVNAGLPRRCLRWVLLAILSAGAIAFGEWLFIELRRQPDWFPVISWAGYILSVIIFFCVVCVFYAITNRMVFSFAVISSLYLGVQTANIVKVRFMHAAVQPMDYQYLHEFLPFFTQFFGWGTAVVVCMAGTFWAACLVYSWRRWPCRNSVVVRLATGLPAVAVLWLVCQLASRTQAGCFMGTIGIEEMTWDSVRSMSQNGLLPELALSLSRCFVQQPADYGEATIHRLVRDHKPASAVASPATATQPPDLIVYLVESFMDPRELGIKLSADPIPSFRSAAQSHTSGYAIVPCPFGGSANTEFEVLTGMAIHCLPSSSCPYKKYIKRDIPGLPAFLKQHGYRTVAVHADPRSTYNREEVYRLMGIDETVWLNEKAGVPRSVSGAWVADTAVVDAVTTATTGTKPCFVFAFPGSTHSPYNYELPPECDIEVAESIPEPQRKELKVYLNALKIADASIQRMFDHYLHSERKVVIVVLGDHLPPLTADVGPYARTNLDIDARERQRKVPLLIWSNFPMERRQVTCSTNFVGLAALKAIGIAPEGYFGLIDSFNSQFSVLSGYSRTKDGKSYDHGELPPAYQAIERDYQLLQYDILFGRRYALDRR